jgi:hypothetical protein
MDLNNDKYLDFSEFSKILMGSMRADFRLKALFTFYVYDQDEKGLTYDNAGQFINVFHQIIGHLGADDLNRILTLCNKCAESGGKKTRSDKRVYADCKHHL